MRDRRFAELDRLIAAGLGDMPGGVLIDGRPPEGVQKPPRARRGSLKAVRLEEQAGKMRRAGKGRRKRGRNFEEVKS